MKALKLRCQSFYHVFKIPFEKMRNFKEQRSVKNNAQVISSSIKIDNPIEARGKKKNWNIRYNYNKSIKWQDNYRPGFGVEGNYLIEKVRPPNK